MSLQKKLLRADFERLQKEADVLCAQFANFEIQLQPYIDHNILNKIGERNTIILFREYKQKYDTHVVNVKQWVEQAESIPSAFQNTELSEKLQKIKDNLNDNADTIQQITKINLCTMSDLLHCFEDIRSALTMWLKKSGYSVALNSNNTNAYCVNLIFN